MDDDLAKNSLIGLTTADTLLNVKAIISLFKDMEFCDDMEDVSQYGLFMIHTLMGNALEYEVNRLGNKDT